MVRRSAGAPARGPAESRPAAVQNDRARAAPAVDKGRGARRLYTSRRKHGGQSVGKVEKQPQLLKRKPPALTLPRPQSRPP